MRSKVIEKICQDIHFLLLRYGCLKLCEPCPLRSFTLLFLQFSLKVASTSLIHSRFIVSPFKFLHNILGRYLWGKNTHTINYA